MEDLLTQLQRDASGTKYAQIRKACQDALALLENDALVAKSQAYQIREKCLEPLQLALESRSGKLTTYAIGGLQKMMHDDRFHSSMESEREDRWMPMQVLNTVWSTPNLPDETQVEVMKVLLNMTFSTSWCMNARVITKIAQVSIDSYSASTQSSVRTAVKATLTQMLTGIAERLNDKLGQRDEDASDVLADFKSNGHAASESLSEDVVSILTFLCKKLSAIQSPGQNRQVEPLLLEGIYAIISNIPASLQHNKEFINLLWQELCPNLVSLLGNPKLDKSISSQKTGTQEEVGRGSGCSSSAPNVVGAAAKTIYNIAIELVRLMGGIRSLRPVLESVFHRMLLYPPPQHRQEALKAVKELLSSPERLIDLAGPTAQEVTSKSRRNSKKTPNSDMALLKLIMDGVQESCHCNDSSVCITSVQCVDLLLTSLEELTQGAEIDEDLAREIHIQYQQLEKDGRMEGLPASPEHGNILFYEVDHDGFCSQELHAVDRTDDGDTDSDSEADDDVHSDHLDNEEDGDEVDKTHVLKYDKNEDENDENYKSQLHDEGEIQMHYGLNSLRADYEMVERQNAQEFTEYLLKFLPTALNLYSTYEVDQMMQKFSSNFCAGLSDKPRSDSEHVTILNADGVYIATYSALLLNLKLLQCGYYASREKSLPISEQQFIDDILGCGLLLYLSPAWLSELYHQVITTDLLAEAGFDREKHRESPFITMIIDIDGLMSRHVGGQLLTGCTETKNPEQQTDDNKFITDAGMKFTKRILTECWDGILDVLSVLLDGKSSCGISSSLALMLGTEGAKEESMRARDAICMSLDGLQKAARLACSLGLQSRCGAVFGQLSNASCLVEESRRSPLPERKGMKPSVLPSRSKMVRLHAAHVLSMDVVLSIGLEMGSHSSDCWKHVFRCCAHVTEEEHLYFSSGNNQSSLPKVQQQQPKNTDPDDAALSPLDLGSADIMNSTMMPSVPVAPSINVPELIRQSNLDGSTNIIGGGVLNAAQGSKVLCGLSQQVDRLFDDAANKLNMQALVGFMTELCKASKKQLARPVLLDPVSGLPMPGLPTTAMHLYHLGSVLLQCLTNGRPLLHIMRIWSVVAPHFVEAACHKDRSISKKAVTCIHECVTTLLSTHQELPHFHFNESLAKPFENLLCLELCDGDVQDQIVCSICELVEACTMEIKSGWRPLFGALRAVKIEYTTNEEVNEARQRHVAAVLDVFEVFLNTDNVLVFANAAVDCILCLLKYVRGPGEFEDVGDDDSDSGSDLQSMCTSEDLCLPALKYLQQCCTILASMWSMPACPIFNGAHRIKMTATPKYVDPVIPDVDLSSFKKHYNTVPAEEPKTEEKPMDSRSLNSVDSGIGGAIGQDVSPNKESQAIPSAKSTCSENTTEKRAAAPSINIDLYRTGYQDFHPVTLEELDNHTGILHVWFLVLEGLANTVSTCPRTYQPQTLEVLFEMLRAAATTPGPDFSIHCVNHLLLPMLQSWLRHGSHLQGYWETSAANFKQCCGLCTDLVVEYIVQFATHTDCQSGLELMLKQLLDVLIECVAQPIESISRLGCSCIRHALLSSGPLFTEAMWHVASVSLLYAFDVSLYPIQQLMTLFHANSDNFYGDIGQVKVAARKDCSAVECERLRQLAQQVFLLDNQRVVDHCPDYEPDDERSYVFLLYPPNQSQEPLANPEQNMTRVSFKSIVVSLLSHQLLLQTVGCILLQGTSFMSPSERHLLPSSPKHSLQKQGSMEKEEDLMQDTHMPGMLRYMSTRNVLTVLQCLSNSYQMSLQFDCRPGLKFLIQKVADASVASNLYKQAGVARTFYIHALMEICAHQDNLCIEHIKKMLLLSSSSSSKPSAEAAAAENKGTTNTTSQEDHHKSIEDMQKSMEVFVRKLREAVDETSSSYIDMILDHEGLTNADRISDKPLFFLVAQPEEVPSLKRDKSLMAMVAEKLQLKEKKPMATQAVAVQGTPVQEPGTPAESEDVFSQEEATSGSPQHEKKRGENEDRVYTVASEKTIKNLMSAYKKRKQHHSMPSFVKAGRSKPPPVRKERAPSNDPKDQEIDNEQKASIMKDSEARLKSWAEMICTILQLFHQLPDLQYRSLLPTVFNSVNQLVCHTSDIRLKESLAQWAYRVGHLYGIAPT